MENGDVKKLPKNRYINDVSEWMKKLKIDATTNNNTQQVCNVRILARYDAIFCHLWTF